MTPGLYVHSDWVEKGHNLGWKCVSTKRVCRRCTANSLCLPTSEKIEADWSCTWTHAFLQIESMWIRSQHLQNGHARPFPQYKSGRGPLWSPKSAEIKAFKSRLQQRKFQPLILTLWSMTTSWQPDQRDINCPFHIFCTISYSYDSVYVPIVPYCQVG